jgi:lysophospholipase L1-like esterase
VGVFDNAWVKRVIAPLVAALLLFCIVFWAALGRPPLSGTALEWVLVFIVITLVSLALGTLGCGVYIEVARPTWTHFRWWHYVYLALVGIGLVAGDVFFFWWLVSSDAGGLIRWIFLIGSVAAIGAGAVLAWVPVRLPLLTRPAARGLAAQPRRALWPQARTDAGADWTPSVPLWMLLGVVAGVIAAVGYLGISAWYENAEIPAAPALPAAPADIHGGYLAIGDSYSAGEGLTPFVTGTAATNCDRSANPDTPAYPTLIARLLKTRDFTFTACSGAIINDVLSNIVRNNIPVPPQVDVSKDGQVGLVTLTIGGNDAIFWDVIQLCLLEPDCMTDPGFPPGGTGEEEMYPRVPEGAVMTQWGPKTIEEIGTQDAALFSVLRSDFPAARIVVIGYPYLLPVTSAPGFPFYPPLCASLLNRFGQANRDDLKALQDAMTDVTYEEAVAAGIEFVSPDAYWNQHMPCGAQGQFTNSIKPYLSFPDPINGGSFHPNAAGQQAMAAVLACYLDANHQPPDPFLSGHPHVAAVPSAHRLETPAQLGLVPPPGMYQAPGQGTIAHC